MVCDEKLKTMTPKIKDNLFVPNFKDLKYTITIDVYDNCNTVSFTPHDKEFEITYQSIIGTLEICKYNTLRQQSDHNRTVAKKLKTKKSK